MKLSAQDFKLITVASLFSAGSLYLWATYNTNFSSRNLETIATIDNTISDVRWKIFGNFDWIKPEKGVGLVSGDQIFTGKDSIAVIEFKKNNSKIVLMENSLVTIQEESDKIIFDIQKGSFELKSAPDANIVIKNKGEIQEIPKVTENLLLKAEKGKIKVEEVAVKIPSIAFPTQNYIYDALAPKNVRLSNIFSGMLEISQNADFTTILKTIPVNNKSTIDDLKIQNGGDFYLRLHRENKFSEIVKIAVSEILEIPQHSPSLSQDVILERGERLRFSWDNLNSSAQNLKISKAGDLLKQIDTNKNTEEVLLSAGDDYSWRVESFENTKLTAKSEDLPFSVFYKNLALTQNKIVTEDIAKKPLELNLPILANESVKVEFLQNGKLIKEFSVDKNKYLVNDLPFGHYQVAVNSNLYRSKVPVYMDAYVKANAVVFNGIKATNLNEIKYTNLYESYSEKGLVEVSIVKNIENLDLNSFDLTINGKRRSKRLKLEGNSVLVGLDGFGDYCLAYKVQDIKEREIFKNSNYCFKHVQVKYFTDVPRPEDQILDRDGLVKLETYTIKLPQNEKAVEYRIQIFADQNLKDQIFAGKSKDYQIKWPSKKSGIFYYRYQLVDKDNHESDFSDVGRIIFPISPFSDWSGKN